MAKLLIDTGGGSGAAKGANDADWTDGSLATAGPVSEARLISALALVLRDEINTLRTLGLIGLSARSVDDIVNAIKAKLT